MEREKGRERKGEGMGWRMEGRRIEGVGCPRLVGGELAQSGGARRLVSRFVTQCEIQRSELTRRMVTLGIGEVMDRRD